MITQAPRVEGGVCEGLYPAWTDSVRIPPVVRWARAMPMDSLTRTLHLPVCQALCQVLDIQRQAFMALGEGSAHFEPSDPTNTYSLYLSH